MYQLHDTITYKEHIKQATKKKYIKITLYKLSSGANALETKLTFENININMKNDLII